MILQINVPDSNWRGIQIQIIFTSKKHVPLPKSYQSIDYNLMRPIPIIPSRPARNLNVENFHLFSETNFPSKIISSSIDKSIYPVLTHFLRNGAKFKVQTRTKSSFWKRQCLFRCNFLFKTTSSSIDKSIYPVLTQSFQNGAKFKVQTRTESSFWKRQRLFRCNFLFKITSSSIYQF